MLIMPPPPSSTPSFTLFLLQRKMPAEVFLRRSMCYLFLQWDFDVNVRRPYSLLSFERQLSVIFHLYTSFPFFNRHAHTHTEATER